MPYRISADEHIAHEAQRVKGVLLSHMDPAVDYTLDDLLSLCADYGLDYTNPEYQEIGQALITDGFLVLT